jgi:prepilin-type N-terminal cleavage/methylation domain-containing protein
MKSRRSRTAFTLVELLVVIAVIAILAALLLPAIMNSPRPAYGTYCLDNLRQISIAIRMYVDDWGHDASGSTNNFTSPFLNWTSYRTLTAPYLSIKHPPSPDDHMFACPKDTFYYALSSKDPPVTQAPLHSQSNYLFTSYAYNAGMVTTRPTTNSDRTVTPGTTNFNGIAGTRMNSIPHPSRTVLMAEIPAFAPYSWHSPKKPLTEKNSKFNDSRNIVSFVDGHAANIKMYYNGQKLAWDYNPPAGYEYQWTGD